MKTFEIIKKKLDELSLPYKLKEHKHVHTSEQAAKVRGYSKKEGMMRGAKAMIIRSKKKFYQFVLPGNKKLDFKKIKQILDTNSASLAKPSEVKEVIGCEIGSVPPCGTLFGIPTYVEESLMQNDEVDFNAGLHTVTITMKLHDWVTLVKPTVKHFSIM